MKRMLALTFAALTSFLAFPALHAQQGRVFTTGTSSELQLAQSRSLAHLRERARQKGVDAENGLRATRVDVDDLSMAHTRVQQYLRGVPVFGGEAIVHLRANAELFAETDSLVPHVSVDTNPRISSVDAINMAVTDYGCAECLTGEPITDLWIMRQEGVDHLVYRVQMRRMDGTEQTALPVTFVDAHDGQIVWRYDDLQTGTGASLYSGTVPVNTWFFAPGGGYALEDLGRRVGTFDLRNTSQLDFFWDFLDGDDVWNASTQRAAVDAHYGSARYFDYLSAVHGRNGIDGNGGPGAVLSLNGVTPLVSSFVHYGVNYPNAFWSRLDRVMVYGDGDGLTLAAPVSLDVVGHEMTHGLNQFTANLSGFGESGALNESWADVFGAMLERHVRGESANTWWIGEQVTTPGIPGDALRYMDDPHRAANSGATADDDPDHYSERYTGAGDNGGVHINSGISNKAFYLLAKGGTHHRGGSMTGIGADAAARIWFTALRSYMTSSTNFAGARTATLNAAAALYGTGSSQYAAVSTAWCLVGVGTCTVPTTNSVSPSGGSASSQIFVLQYSDSAGATNLSTAWVWFHGGSATSSPTNSCLVHYDRAANTINLLNDSATAWSAAAIGTATTLQNSQCAVAVGSSSAALSGTSLTLNVAMNFKVPFAGTKNIFMYAANTTGANSGWQTRGTWTVPSGPVAVVTVGTATPSAGSGATQTFALQYSDSLGATDLSTAWVWFNGGSVASSSANSCLVYYDRAANIVNLLNDSAAAWMPGTPGTTTTLQNSQCAVSLASSSTSVSGSTLTLTLAMAFKPAFAGAKNIFMYAANGTGTNSGWNDRGDWTVPAAPAASVSADLATPNAGSGATQTFTFQYGNTAGAIDLRTVWVWFHDGPSTSSSANSCLVHYDRATNTLNLLNDSATAWLTTTAGTANTLQNNQCGLAVESSSAVSSGTTLTLNLPMTFKPAFSGAKNIYMYAASGVSNSGWQDRGDWTVPAPPQATVSADSVTPGTGSGANQSFALQYSYTLGATDLSTTWAWFHGGPVTSSSANSCLIYYDQPANTLNLLTNAGTAWMTAIPGVGTTLQNSQCAIDLARSSAVVSGTTLTLNLAMAFKPAFSGGKNIYMYAASASSNSSWQDRGDWTVPGPATAVVTADSVAPSSGSGAAEKFALQYGDTLGATDLSTVWAWFHGGTVTSSSANSCLMYYDQSTNTLNLVNDTATAWISATLGSPTTLQNSQCAIALADSSAIVAGTTLTMNLAMTFKTAFSGGKNIYMYAASALTNSGWQDRGDWTVTDPGSAVVTADSATPNGGTGATESFALQYSDTFGATDLHTLWVWFHSGPVTSSAANSCLAYYDRIANTLNLVNDAATEWMPSTPGSATTLQNSQCAIDLSASSVSVSGNALTLNLAIAFNSGFGGPKNIYMYAASIAGPNSGWQDRGDWTVPGVTLTSAP